MAKKKKQAQVAEQAKIPEPWCYYCNKKFSTEGILIQHQKEKHFKCEVCKRKLTSANGMKSHCLKRHGHEVESVPNAITERANFGAEVYGMQGIPCNMLTEQERILYSTQDQSIMPPMDLMGYPFMGPPMGMPTPSFLMHPQMGSMPPGMPFPCPMGTMPPGMPLGVPPPMPHGVPPPMGAMPHGMPPGVPPPMGSMPPGMPHGVPPHMGAMPPGMPPGMASYPAMPPGYPGFVPGPALVPAADDAAPPVQAVCEEAPVGDPATTTTSPSVPPPEAAPAQISSQAAPAALPKE
eukprot:TRINITY_DN3047_c0_g1_i1.p1 TRINITY_DN3047_c0_g1~~TRINITY_DN3047_c0_g1_i1.p1  ORF type:complete len:293 (+),score=22.61 TRINITY_DN3047_c0_g1_i1:137-1015(+)